MSDSEQIFAFQFGEWTVEPHLNRIYRDGDEIQLEPKTLEVLLYLLERPGQTIAVEELLEAIWPGDDVEPNVVQRNLNRIRRALGDEPRPPRYIETIPDRGYKTVAAVRRYLATPHDQQLAADLEAVTPPYPAYEGSEGYTFVCYSHHNREDVYRELVRLKSSGINVWYDEGISPGAEWTEEVAAAIRFCTHFLLFVSPQSVGSKFCMDELQYAQNHAKSLVVVYLSETHLPEGLQLSIGRVQALFKYSMRETSYARKLITTLAREPGQGDPSHPEPVSVAPAGKKRGLWKWLAGVTAAVLLGIVLLKSRDFDVPSVFSPLPENSISVLPFEDITQARNQEWIGASIVSSLRVGLPRQGFQVVGSNSYLDTGQTVESGSARYLVKGSVFRSQDLIRITVEVISTDNEHQVWSEEYIETLKDDLSAQETITQKILLGIASNVSDGADSPTLVATKRESSGTGALQSLLSSEPDMQSFGSFEEVDDE